MILIRKEFKQIFRNRAMLPILFLMPVIQLLILSNAADFEIKQVNLAWEDLDRSALSATLYSKFAGNPYFQIISNNNNQDFNDDLMRRRKIDMVVSIPDRFSKDIGNKIPVEIQLRINAIDGSAAGLILKYVNQTIRDFEQYELLGITESVSFYESRYLFNLEMRYKNYMVPGILVILVTIIGMMLTALNIAREKEIGTIEQINVTPIKKHQFIAGKLIPVLILGFMEFTVGLFIARFIFLVPFFGNLFVLYTFLFVYLIVMLALGLYISTRVNTQQQAMFLCFFVLMIFIFLSGMFSSIENMPLWGQYLSKLIPVSYFIRDIRSIMLKGSQLSNLFGDFLILLLFAAGSFIAAIASYSKKTN